MNLDMEILNQICLWLIVGLLVIGGAHRLKGRRLGVRQDTEKSGGQYSDEKRLRLAEWIIWCVLIVIRSIGFGSIPGGFNPDGAMGAIDALALATYGTDHYGNWLPAHFQAWGFGQMSVLLSYLTVPFIWLWGLNNVTARLPMLLTSIAGAWALYRLVRENLGRRAGVVALLSVAIAPWHFMQSRWALDCNMFPHMFILGLFFLNKGMRKSRYLYLSMVFFALCMYAYGVAFYMVPVFLSVSCVLLLWHRKVNWKQALAAVAVYFGLSWPIYGTMLINFMGWKTIVLPFTTMAFFPNSVRTGDMIFFSEQPLVQLGTNALALWKRVFLQSQDLPWNSLDDFGTVYLCSMPLVLAGAGITIYRTVRGKADRQIFYILLLIYWGSSLLVGFFVNEVNVNRINIIFYCHIIFTVIAIHAVVKEWRRLWIGFVAVYALLSVLFLYQYFTDWPERIEDVFCGDFLNAVEYAGELEADYYYIAQGGPYDYYPWVSQILVMYAVKMDAEYFQGKTNVFRGAEISYTERYHFNALESDQVRDDTRIVYVIRVERVDDYAPDRFARRQFGEYYVVTPWKYAKP